MPVRFPRLAAGLAVASLGLLGAAPRAATAVIRMTDVAVQAGLTLLNVHGGGSGDYILDTNGNGAAFFDYDNDGRLDALIVNGSTRERLARGGDPMVALYRGDGRGRFTDVTASSGMAARGWGMGTCVADIDNDGFDDVYVTAFGANVLYRNTGSSTARVSRMSRSAPAWAMRAGARAVRSATTTATGSWTCTSPTTWRSTPGRSPGAARRRTAATSGSTCSAARRG